MRKVAMNMFHWEEIFAADEMMAKSSSSLSPFAWIVRVLSVSFRKKGDNKDNSEGFVEEVCVSVVCVKWKRKGVFNKKGGM